MRMLDNSALLMQIRKGTRANRLRLERYPLRIAQPLRRPPQPFRAREELLALFERCVPAACAIWVVCVSVAEERFAVGRL